MIVISAFVTMEEARLMLCPHVDMEEIRLRSELILQQMGRVVPNDGLVEQQPLLRVLTCPVCGNEDESMSVIDDNTGGRICLGVDGLGCGVVLTENALSTGSSPSVSDMEENTCEMYSPQNQFAVETTRNNHFRRMNHCIERNLSRFGRENTVTGDAYKDDQRRQVYNLLDHVQMYTGIDVERINRVKMLFHDFRTKMYRIHKLETALCCLIYIAMHE